jgi:hypothetical protein
MAFLAPIAAVATVVGGLASAGGSLVGGMAAKNAGNYQAQVARMNAKIAEDNANRSLERSQIQQEDQDTLTRSQLGTQEALQGASGLSLTGGSQILTRKSAAMLGRRDALNVRQAGELEAYGYKTQAVNSEAQARQAKAAGQSALVGSYFSAAGSLLSSATKFGGDPFKTKS